MKKGRSRARLDSKEARLTPFRPAKTVKPRPGLTKEGQEALESVLRDYKNPASERGDGPLHSVLMYPDNAATLRRAASKASREGRPFTFDELRRAGHMAPVTGKSSAEIPIPPPPGGFDPAQWIPKTPWPPVREPLTRVLDRLKEVRPHAVGCYPDLFELQPNYDTCPGHIVTLVGYCFGQAPGDVLFTLTPNGLTVTLEVLSWTDTRIDAVVAAGLSGLRRHLGEIWVVTGSGEVSNSMPLEFHPIRVISVAVANFCIIAGATGYPPPFGSDPFADRKPFLRGRTLGDPDFSIQFAEVHHSGDGHAEKREPNAAGQSLAQGWHMGLDALDMGCLEFFYRVEGPRGIPPPPVAGLSPWGFFAEISC